MTHELIFAETEQLHLKKLLWATDLHLDAADLAEHLQFTEMARDSDPDGILIGGDICNGYNSLIQLRNLASKLNKPIYFVLGNHDYYYGSIVKTRKMAKILSEEIPQLKYLTDCGIVELTPQTALIGHDGWSDGRSGDFLGSHVLLNDYYLIEELKDITSRERLQRLNDLGTEAAHYLDKTLRHAVKKYDRIVLLTHVPPFREVCWYDGQVCDDNWAPHFVNLASGERLKAIMEEHPTKQLLVLCGHSHESADVHILPNLHVLAGHSRLGTLSIQGTIYIQ